MSKLYRFLAVFFLSALLAGTYASGRAAAEERLAGVHFDSRVTLGFSVPEAAAQAMMPDGWKLMSLPRGPLAGANLLIIFVDRHLSLDAEGNPATPATSRAAVLVSFGIKPGGQAPHGFVTRVYITDPDNKAYGVGVPASIARNSAVEGPSGHAATRREDWVVTPEGGGSIELSLSHKAGVPVRTEGETVAYSAVDPDYYHIYRYAQLGDLVMSEALGKPLAGEVSVSVSVPELSAVFDGSERLVTVISLPWYQRDMFLP